MNALDPGAAASPGTWGLAVAGIGAVVFAAMFAAAKAIEGRRLRTSRVSGEQSRDRALLGLSERLVAEEHPWASLREAAGCAAFVTDAEAAWTFVGVPGAPPAASLATGPVYPVWAGTVENRVMARSVARDAIREGGAVARRQSAGAVWTAVALPGQGDRPAALVVRHPAAPGSGKATTPVRDGCGPHPRRRWGWAAGQRRRPWARHCEGRRRSPWRAHLGRECAG